MQEGLKTVTFNESGQIMLDGKPLEHVKSYRMEKYTNSNEPAELTLIMLVKVGRDNDWDDDSDLSEEEKREIEEDMEKRMNLQGIIASIMGFFVLVLIVLTIFFPY